MVSLIEATVKAMLAPVGILSAIADHVESGDIKVEPDRNTAQTIAALSVLCRHLVELTGATGSALAADFGVLVRDLPDPETAMAQCMADGRATVAYAITASRAEDSAALDSEFDLDAFLESIGMLAAADEDVPDIER